MPADIPNTSDNQTYIPRYGSMRRGRDPTTANQQQREQTRFKDRSQNRQRSASPIPNPQQRRQSRYSDRFQGQQRHGTSSEHTSSDSNIILPRPFEKPMNEFWYEVLPRSAREFRLDYAEFLEEKMVQFWCSELDPPRWAWAFKPTRGKNYLSKYYSYPPTNTSLRHVSCPGHCTNV